MRGRLLRGGPFREEAVLHHPDGGVLERRGGNTLFFENEEMRKAIPINRRARCTASGRLP